MKRVKSETLNGIMLIAILGFLGWRLATNAWTLYRQPDKIRPIAGGSHGAAFQAEGGFDVSGRFISPPQSMAAKRTMVFLLHSASIGDDLDFWHHVRSLLPSDGELRLVGYCDGDACVDAVRHDPLSADFPVIVFGEISNGQAVIDADADGNSILRRDGQPRAGFIRWRAPGKTPLDVAQEAMQ